MLFADALGTVALFGLWVWVLLAVLTAPAGRLRRLPRWGWAGTVLLGGPILGCGLYLLFGRPLAGPPAGPGLPLPPPANDNRTRAAAASPDDDAAFMATLRERAADQRRRAAERRPGEGDPSTGR